MTPEIRFTVLGPLRATVDGAEVALGGAKQQMVLALLLLEANRVVSVDRLVEWVWGDAGGNRSPATLQVYMSNLRRSLVGAGAPEGLILTRRPGYVAQLEEGQLDLLEFEGERRRAEAALAAGRPGDAARSLRRALELWRGDPLAGLDPDASADAWVSRLGVALLTVRELLAEAELAIGRHRELLDELAGWLRAHPFSEELRAHLMLALYRSGRQADALTLYREGRELLVEELGIDPSRELRELEERILNQDPSLDVSSGRVPALGDEGATVVRSSMVARAALLEIGSTSVPIVRAATTIGRAADRDVVVADPEVSRHHAEVRRLPDGYRLVDCGSANGTYRNGARVDDVELASGDRITVGATVITFRLV